MPSDLEIRSSPAELRADGRRLVGHAAVFDQPADLGGFTEVVKRGAFARSLSDGSDILALVDHQPDRLLGRTAARTLTLVEDAIGLGFEVRLPDTTLARDVTQLVERGDIRGASFQFVATEQDWPTRDRRELRQVKLLEVSIVHSFAAYSGTDVAVRSRPGAVNTENRTRLLRLRLAVM